MATPLRQSIICPFLIGRDAQVSALLKLLHHTRSGQGQATLISGEAGIGKSRLAAEVKIRATDLGFAVLQGNCLELDRALPYAPLVELLRVLCALLTPSQVAEQLHPYAPALIKLMPELASTIPDVAATNVLEPEVEKHRLHETLLRFVTDLTQGLTSSRTTLLHPHHSTSTTGQWPLLIIIEDLQWGDDASLEFLLYLARRITLYPILLLLTYRSDEVGPVLSHWLAELERMRLATEIELNRLTADEVELMIRIIFEQPRPVRGEFVEALHGLTDGNPFFIEETLTALMSTGDIYYEEGLWTRRPMSELRIPRTVQDAVQRRSGQLSSEARQLLVLAAVVGRRFDFLLLQRLTGHGEEHLLALIKELLAVQLIVEANADQFVYRHALTRQAIYATLLARERRSLHRAVLAAMEQAEVTTLDASAASPADLAYHAYAAEAWDKVLVYAQQAGEQALALYALHAALAHFARALEATLYLQQTPPSTLHRARGQAYALLSEFHAARTEYERALELARSRRELAAEWQSLIDLGALAQEHNFRRAGEYFQAALALARTRQEPVSIAHSLNWLGRWLSMMDQPQEARRLQQEALAIFQELDDRRGLAATLSFLGWTNYVGSDLYASVEFYTQAVALCREVDARQQLIFSLAGLAMRGADYFQLTSVWPPVDLASCQREVEAAIQLARQIGYRSGEARILIWCALGLGPRGEYAQALNFVQTALHIALEDTQNRYVATARIVLGALHLDLLALTEARQQLEQGLALAQAIDSPTVIRVATGFLALTYIAQQELVMAESLLDSVQLSETSYDSKPQRLVWCAKAELALAQGQPAKALSIIKRLIAATTNSDATDQGLQKEQPGHVIPRLWHLRGEALAAQGQPEEAELVLQAALSVAQAQAARSLVWRIQVSLARLYQGQRRRDQAQGAWGAARALVEELASPLEDVALREQFIRRAIEQMPQVAPVTALRTAKQAYAGLTAREREVAALIAKGQSNRAIAGTLVISERTTAKHVENIFSKLGFTARAQIAAWAVEKGLVQELNSNSID